MAEDVQEHIDPESDGEVPPERVEAPSPTADTAPERRREDEPAFRREPSALSSSRLRWAVLGGARASVLAKVPAEADRFTQMLPLLLATAILSGISMAFAIATGVLPNRSYSWYAAIPVALVWSALIFIVDRSLTASMKSTRSRARLLLAAIPRVLLAALIGVVVSGPLVLQVFANDIRQEMVTNNLDNGVVQVELLQKSDKKQRLDDATAELAKLNQQAETGVIADVENASQATADLQAQIERLSGDLATREEKRDTARDLVNCERYGTPLVEGCTGVPGEGRRLADAESALKVEQDAVDDLNDQLDMARSQLADAESTDIANSTSSAQANRDAAKAQLPEAQAEYDAALDAYTTESKNISQANSQAIGLIAQMRALEKLQEKDITVAALHWAIAGLFFVIELMPVFVKMFRSYGDPTPYELAEEADTTAAAAEFGHAQQLQVDQLDHERQLQAHLLARERFEEHRRIQAQAEAAWTVDQDMRDREVRIGVEQNERVASRMEVVVGHALDQWDRDVDRVFEQGQTARDEYSDLDYRATANANAGGPS